MSSIEVVAAALYEAIQREFDGFPDEEMRLETHEALAAFEEWRVGSLLVATARVDRTACDHCGGSGVVKQPEARR